MLCLLLLLGLFGCVAIARRPTNFETPLHSDHHHHHQHHHHYDQKEHQGHRVVVESVQLFECPSEPGDSPVVVPSDSTIDLRVTGSGLLCTLTRVVLASNKNGIDDSSIAARFNSGNAKTPLSFAPVGRSYDGHAWESVAGPFPTLDYNCSSSSKVCRVQIPSAVLAPDESTMTSSMSVEFHLTTFTHDCPPRDKAARFLLQSTFGPTRDDLDTWNTASSMSLSMSSWIHHQMHDIEPTLHRSYFRRHANPRYIEQVLIGPSSHPCYDAGTRWRTFALSPLDYKQTLVIGSISLSSSSSSTLYVLLVNGKPRTTFTYKPRFGSGDEEKINVGRKYEICQRPVPRIGGRIYIKEEGKSCRQFDMGNPPVRLPRQFVLSSVSTVSRHSLGALNTFLSVVNLPRGDLSSVQHSPMMAEDYLLTSPLDDDSCRSILNFDDELFGVIDAGGGSVTLTIHDPRLILHDNTNDDPWPDGGGSVVQRTSDDVVCANAPRTFLNERDCILSTEPNACSGSAATLAEDTTLLLDRSTLLTLHNITGLYIYAIDGLRIDEVEEEENEVKSPCTPGTRSRWMAIPMDETSTGCQSLPDLEQTTVSVLQGLLSSSGDRNPMLRDIYFPEAGTTICDDADQNAKGMEIIAARTCWRHVHHDHWSVFDMTPWTAIDAHPGNVIRVNAGLPNPIEDFANHKSPKLYYPSNHALNRWSMHKSGFTYIGRWGDEISLRDLPEILRTDAVGKAFGASSDVGASDSDGAGVIVCGSPGEVANDVSLGQGFQVSVDQKKDITPKSALIQQRKAVWSMVALAANDQLRQRAAWALSQILVISPADITPKQNTEIYLTYYDIFVRNAFGNYRNVLREVSYSPLMAEMLTYLESKSTSYIWDRENKIAFADENFAREVMQLFTIGLVQLNDDGTTKIDKETGEPILAYTNDDILSFARAWTGFARQRRRGNYEDFIEGSNRIDPMRIIPLWRDGFPKMGLGGRSFIGDRFYPLCVDMPPSFFLRRGARYRLLGSSMLPELQQDPAAWLEDPTLPRFSLDSSISELYRVLCDPQPSSSSSSSSSGADSNGMKCHFQSEVILDSNLSCRGNECLVDTVRIVQVAPNVFYEYVRPPCVEFPFINGAKKVTDWKGQESMCAHPGMDVASEACCPPDDFDNAVRSCEYVGERMTYERAQQRCADNVDGVVCNFDRIVLGANKGCSKFLAYHWTDIDCPILAKIDQSGMVAVVHDPGSEVKFKNIPSHVRDDTRSYFRVNWNDNIFPSITNECGNGAFEASGAECFAQVEVIEDVVFSSMPSRDEVLTQLFVGSVPPEVYDDGTYVKREEGPGLSWYARTDAINMLGKDSIFRVETYHDDGHSNGGQILYLRNVAYTVRLKSKDGTISSYSFRNPPHFMSLVDLTLRDAQYETEAVLDHYLYNENTGPFLAYRFIQRFGISNPSPRFVQEVATAFRRGLYEFDDEDGVIQNTFGSGNYGDLAATFAAILLDRESRSVLLDADPAQGSLREPLIKVISFMRSMEFVPNESTNIVNFLALEDIIGQMAHEIPTVFSFFLPDHAPPGPVVSASLVAPEAQVIHMPTIVGTLNGLFSLIKFGLSECYGGLGIDVAPDVRCSDLVEGLYTSSSGRLRYDPDFNDNSVSVVDEIATLLTGGRLSEANRRIIRSEFSNQLRVAGRSAAVRSAQQLVVSSPEFHTTGAITEKSGEKRDPSTKLEGSCNAYKAVVYLFLEGGCDSYNMLVPHSNCPNKDMYDEYKKIRDGLAVDRDDLLKIDANSKQQPCRTFGLNPRLSILHELYTSNEAIMLANTGVLNQPVTKEDHLYRTRTRLFAHDAMQREVKRIDPFHNSIGTGLLGRMVDALKNDGTKVQSYSVDKSTVALVGAESPQTVVHRNGIQKFDPYPSSESIRLAIEDLNEATTLHSSVFGETWSSALHHSFVQNSALYHTLRSSEIETTFPKSGLGKQLEVVSRIISSHHCRGTDRDVFYVQMGGFDTHDDMIRRLNSKFDELNDAVEAFVQDMKAQGQWDNVVVVSTSDFARTLSPNSGDGSDHGWGGHHFILGGKVKGGRMMGTYPDDLTDNAPLNVGRGRYIPTTSWEAVWNGVAQWFGILDDVQLDKVLPNRQYFPNDLLSSDDLFVDSKSSVSCDPDTLGDCVYDDDKKSGGRKKGKKGGNDAKTAGSPIPDPEVLGVLVLIFAGLIAVFVGLCCCTSNRSGY